MKNKILIKIALKLLSWVDENQIEFKNSWKHYCSKIKEFLDDESNINNKDKAMEHCFWNVLWFNHYIKFTKSYKFVIIGKRENQWVDKVNINCEWWQKVETCYKKAPYIVFIKGKGVVAGRCFGFYKCSEFTLISLYFVHIRICPSKEIYDQLPQGG